MTKKTDVIAVPDPDRPMSALDGFSSIALDADPDSALYGIVANSRTLGIEVVAIVPVKFHGVRDGYLVVTYDKTKDPRAQKEHD